MKKLQKGFTLIELMIVVAIIAILAAVAAPKFGQQLRKAQDAKGVEIVGAWRSALNIDYSDAGVYSANFGGLTDNVDTGTISKSYSDATGNTAMATTNTLTVAYVKVGTGATGSGKTAQFGFDSTSTTENAINFKDTGVDTKGTSWSAY